MPQYAVLHHREHPTKADHWDFMLEDNRVLLTFALPECPDRILQLTTCETLPDHRLRYLDYEGPISGDRGNVSRWDRGSFRWLTRSSDTLRGEVSGDRLCGVFEIRTQPQPPTTAFCYYPAAETEN